MWLAIVAFIVGIALGAASAGTEDETAGSDESTSTTRRSTTTTERESTSTSERTTTTEAPTTTTIATTTVPPQPVEVARFIGVNNTDTANFTVQGAWEIHYDSAGGAGFGITINNAAGEFEDGFTVEPGPGVSLRRSPQGELYLEISTFGSDRWSVRIVDIPG